MSPPNLPTFVSAFAAAEFADRGMVLMALGTIGAETEAESGTGPGARQVPQL